MISHTKKMKPSELFIYKKCSQAGISPRILSVTSHGRDKLVTTEAYPTTLLAYAKSGNTVTEELAHHIDLQIQKLHDLGVIHGDLHGNNILLNPGSDEPENVVKIIDFGESLLFNKCDQAALDHLNDFIDPDTPFRTREDVLEYEKEMYKRDCLICDV